MNDPLKLENQICFPLYACAKGVVGKYKPFLDEIGLTYTQYITMMVMWERKAVNVKTLGESLMLDSGTLTPLLKKLEEKNLVTRERSSEDERNLVVTITAKGEQLRKKAEKIPTQIAKCLDISPEDATTLYEILHRVMAKL
jgi:DNA-binding MarR family transcriptional regulator